VHIKPTLDIVPLQICHLEELARVLLCPEVYEHIESPLPSTDEFVLGLRIGISGPPADAGDEKWLNFLVRDSSGQMIGRLEATIHHGIAEVAFLFGFQFWGQGYGYAGVQWLHQKLIGRYGIADLWATTTKQNFRSQRLLERCGYERTQLPAVPIYSYDQGDLVFRKIHAT